MAKRTSKKVIADITKLQFDDSLSAYAIADARKQLILSRMDEQITKIREKYADEIMELDGKLESEFAIVQTYCSENQNVLFAKKKSMETAHGVVGFRTGTPKLKTEKGFTWASVLTLLKKVLPEYVRTKEEPNKEALLLDREKPEIRTVLPEVGLVVDQDETFFL